MRRAAKVDRNQAEIVKALRQAGYSVHDTSRLGGGFPDLVVGLHSVNVLLEVKDGDAVPSKRKLTKDESEFFDTWKGAVFIVEDVAGALNICKKVTNAR